jgi:hypothetical protein
MAKSNRHLLINDVICELPVEITPKRFLSRCRVAKKSHEITSWD